jgi:hypothetical protein
MAETARICHEGDSGRHAGLPLPAPQLGADGCQSLAVFLQSRDTLSKLHRPADVRFRLLQIFPIYPLVPPQ